MPLLGVYPKALQQDLKETRNLSLAHSSHEDASHAHWHRNMQGVWLRPATRRGASEAEGRPSQAAAQVAEDMMPSEDMMPVTQGPSPVLHVCETPERGAPAQGARGGGSGP